MILLPCDLNKLPVGEAITHLNSKCNPLGRSILYEYAGAEHLAFVKEEILKKISLKRFLKDEGLIERTSPIALCIKNNTEGIPWNLFSPKECFKNKKKLLKLFSEAPATKEAEKILLLLDKMKNYEGLQNLKKEEINL